MAAADVAVRNALAAYLQARLGLSADACQPDWFPATQALPRPVAVAVHAAGEVTLGDELAAPQLVAATPDAGSDPPTATALYKTGEWRVPLAVDVWCATQAERDAYVDLLDDALNQPPSVAGTPVANALAGLTLACTADDYFGAVATFDGDGYDARAEPEGTDREAWRASFRVTARVDRLRRRTIRRQTALVVQLEARPAADVAAPGTTATTAETVFTGG